MFRSVTDVSYFTTDSRGSQDSPDGAVLLELNEGERSIINPLDHLHDGSAVSSLIIPHVQALAPSYDVVSLGRIGKFSDNVIRKAAAVCEGSTRRKIMLPEFCSDDDNGIGSAPRFNSDEKHSHHIGNGNPLIREAFTHKGIMAEMMRDCGADSPLPKTKNYLSPLTLQDFQTLIATASTDFENHARVVIKPVDACQGQGIMLKAPEDIPETLANIFGVGDKSSKISSDWTLNHWRIHRPNSLQIQAFRSGVRVEHRGNQWDATTRILWSCVTGENAQGQLQSVVKAHGGFYKLPRLPINGAHLGYVSDQSLSKSSARGIRDYFETAAKRLFSGAGEKIVLTEEELKSASTPLQHSLEKLFAHLSKYEYDYFSHQYTASESPVKHTYGLELLLKTTPDYRDLLPFMDERDVLRYIPDQYDKLFENAPAAE